MPKKSYVTKLQEGISERKCSYGQQGITCNGCGKHMEIARWIPAEEATEDFKRMHGITWDVELTDAILDVLGFELEYDHADCNGFRRK